MTKKPTEKVITSAPGQDKSEIAVASLNDPHMSGTSKTKSSSNDVKETSKIKPPRGVGFAEKRLTWRQGSGDGVRPVNSKTGSQRYLRGRSAEAGGDDSENSLSEKNIGPASKQSKRGRSQSDSLINSGSASRIQMLHYSIIQRLGDVLKTSLQFSSRQPRMPALQTSLPELILSVKRGLEQEQIHLRDVRLGGGAACYVLADKPPPQSSYNGLEIIFGVDCSGAAALNLIRSTVLKCLLEFISEEHEDIKHSLTERMIKDAYVHRMVRVNNISNDCWSLLSLGNPLVPEEKILDLKFIIRMKRQFEFTVDSFQIVLDTMLSFLATSTQPVTEHFYPPVVAESTSGDFEEALHHLNHHLIATRNPEELRGGGLLKYCNLLVEGYKPVDARLLSSIERYMCSRFFIDFPDLSSQLTKLEAYLTLHYGLLAPKRVTYLRTLRRVIAKSTVCLTQQERRRTLHLIDYCIQRLNASSEASNKDTVSVVELEEFNSQDWSLDQVFYGTSYFPQEIYVQYTLPTVATILPLNEAEGTQHSPSTTEATAEQSEGNQLLEWSASAHGSVILPHCTPVLVASQ